MREMVIVKVTGGLWKGNDTSTSYLLPPRCFEVYIIISVYAGYDEEGVEFEPCCPALACTSYRLPPTSVCINRKGAGGQPTSKKWHPTLCISTCTNLRSARSG